MAYHREDSVSSRVSNNGYVFLPSNFKSHNEISSPFEHVIFVLLSLFVNVYIYLFILFIYIYNVLYCFRLFCCLYQLKHFLVHLQVLSMYVFL